MKNISPSQLILAGDVGGTKTRLGLFRVSRNKSRLLTSESFRSNAYNGLEEIIKAFLQSRERISAASFGVAGPVINGIAVATNLPWTISEQSLKKVLSLNRLSLINDLVANAYGIEVMQKKDFVVLNTGKNVSGNRAILSAGTGLGAAIMFWDGKQHIPSASEGGHVEFGPKNRLELDLLKYLFEQFGHVSYERILSGDGLIHIYQFLKDAQRFGKEPVWLTARMEQEHTAAVITEAARLGKCMLCVRALDFFASIYGAAAGNLALQVMATGGVYIGGGIAPKIIWKLKDGSFIKAFKDKGRLSSLVKRIPVKVIMNDNAALFGAAEFATRLFDKR